MKKLLVAALSVLLLAGVIASTDGFAANPSNALAKFEKKLDTLIDQCTKELQKADSVAEMNEIATECDADVFGLLADLEEELGHDVAFEPFLVCVTNTDVQYTACFDPIIITGGS